MILGIILLFVSFNTVHSVLIIDTGVTFKPDNSDTTFTFANQYNVTTLDINKTHIEINGHMLKAEPVTGTANCTIYEFNTSTTAKYRSFNMTATNTSDKIDYIVGGYSDGDLVGIVINRTTVYPTRTTANSTGYINFTHMGYNTPQNITFMILENETYSDETFDGNVYTDNYEPVNVTLNLDSGFVASTVTSYTIPYNLDDVNISSIQVIDKDNVNTTFTRTDNTITFTAFGANDPYTTQYDVKAVKNMTVAEYGTCPLYYTGHTTYCSREVVVTPGSLSTYYYRYFINVTRNETNSSHILHNQSTGIFTTFATRDNLTVRVNDNSINTSVSVIGSTLQYNITNEHQSGSLYSLNEGTYYIDVWYNVVTGTPAGGGGGGGGGGGTVGDGVNTTGECIIDSDCYNLYGYSRRYCVNTSCSEIHGFDCWVDKDCIYKYGIKKPYCVKNDCKSASEIECWYNSDCIAKYGDSKAYCINYECTSSKDALSFDIYPRELNVETIVGDTERYQIRVVNYASEPFAFTLDIEGNHAEWITIPNHQTLWNIDPLKSITFSIDVLMKEPVYNEMSVLRVKAKRELSTDIKELPINFNAIEGKALGVFCDSDLECLSKNCADHKCASLTITDDTTPAKKPNYILIGVVILFISGIAYFGFVNSRGSELPPFENRAS